MKNAIFAMGLVFCLSGIVAQAAPQSQPERCPVRTTVAPIESPDSGAWSWVAEIIEKIIAQLPV